jgi:hypothetical protein
MIVMLGGREGSNEVLLLLVLEPGNLEKLKEGKPIHKWLNEFIPGLPQKVELLFAYTPDAEWVAREIGANFDLEHIAETIERSLERKPIVNRAKSAEDLKRVF